MSANQKFILAAGTVILFFGMGLLVFERFYREKIPVRVTSEGLSEAQELREARAGLREAEEYLRQNSEGAAREALAIFNKVYARNLNPEINQMARFGLASAMERIGERSAALMHYRNLKKDAISDESLKERVDFHLGRLLLDLGQEEEGKSLLDSLLARTVNNELKSDIHAVYGVYYMRKKDRQKARENFSIALRYNPDNVHSELARAAAVRKGETYPVIYDLYDSHLLRQKDSSKKSDKEKKSARTPASYERGLKAYQEGRYPEAVTEFRKAAESETDPVIREKAWYWLGESYSQTGDFRSAHKAYDRVISQSPRDMDQAAHIKKGILYYQSGNLKDALAQFDAAVENFPSGAFTARAEEWRRETQAQINETGMFRSYGESGPQREH